MLGNRIVKRVYSSATGGTVGYTRFFYHGAQVAFEGDSAGTLTWLYVWGAGVDHLLAARDSARNEYYAATDLMGSLRGWYTKSGSWVMGERYEPYGTRTAVTGTDLGLAYQWTGREYDAEMGFYYLRARYYDPSAGRFVQEDPTGYDGGSNLYAYVGGAVFSATDPSGMSPTPDGAFKMDGYIWAGNPGVYAQDDVVGQGDPWASLDGLGGDYQDQLMNAVAAGCPEGSVCYPDWLKQLVATANASIGPAVAAAVSAIRAQTSEAIGTTATDGPDATGTLIDWIAAFGDFWTGDGTKVARQYILPSIPDNVNYSSDRYLQGTKAGLGSGLLLIAGGAMEYLGWRSKIAIHVDDGHDFGSIFGQAPHLQINTWWAGIKGSGWVLLRLPIWFDW